MSTHSCSNCGYTNETSAKFCGNCGRDFSQPSVGASLVGATILGRYAIRRVVAVGGMGVVYEADQSLGDYHRTVAIKTLRPELSQDPTIISRFNRECGIVAQLTHQNTVSLYDYGATEDGTLYIAMEFVRGRALAEAIVGGALPLARTLHILDQMCHSLEEAHNLGIIHRDLKPDNVILSQRGSESDFVKVLDFGIAVRLSVGSNHETKLTQQGMILGTPPYMSPEQFTGARVTRQSDIYSLGIIAYEALTGELPFSADSPWTWAQRHLTATPPDLPPSFPAHVVTAIREALSKDPAQRAPTALDFYRMLAGDRASEARATDALVIDRLMTAERAKTEPDVAPLGPVEPTTSRVGSRVEKTDPAAPPAMLVQSPPYSPAAATAGVQPPPYANLRLGAPVERVKRRPSRKGLWIGLIVAVALCGGGLGAAYSMDLIENPFADDAQPNALPLLPSGPTNSSSSSAPSLAPGVELLPDSPNTPSLNPTPYAGSRTHSTIGTLGAAGSPARGTPAPSSTGSAAPGTVASSAPGGFGLPPFTLPTSLPSLPSSLPPLPTSIIGIPIPPLFPGLQPQPSAAPSPS